VNAGQQIAEHGISLDTAAMTMIDFALAVLAAAAAGLVNALAGGGTLISFPALLALGVSPIAANVTNAVALAPGYFGATLAQRENLRGQAQRLWWCVPAAICGGLTGGILLLHTHERTFQQLVPWMLCVASLLLALQARIRAAVARRLSRSHRHLSSVAVAVPVVAAGIYGGFFTAGMSVIVLALLGATLDDSLSRLNALKQIVAFSINIAAAIFFLFSDQLIWPLATVMAVGATLGGVLGGRVARGLNPTVLRWMVVTVGFALALYYWAR
jgi:uncharacterized membrane protein YfcA